MPFQKGHPKPANAYVFPKGHKLNEGRKLSEEGRKKVSEFQTGRTRSEETRRRMSEAKKLSGSPWLRGRKLTDEHRAKIKANHARFWKGKSPTQEVREKLSEAFKGEKSHLWKGGLTAKNQIIRTSGKYRQWREAVLKRDNYTCVWCGAKSQTGKSVYLQADHIKPFAYFPDLRFDVNNGRTLCEGCHKKTETYGSKVFAAMKNQTINLRV